MKINQIQKNGIATSFDIIGASALVTAVSGFTGHFVVTKLEIIALLIGYLGCLLISLFLRRSSS